MCVHLPLKSCCTVLAGTGSSQYLLIRHENIHIYLIKRQKQIGHISHQRYIILTKQVIGSKKTRFPALDWINLKIEKETWCSLFIVYSHQHVFTCKAAISLYHFFETQFTCCRWHMTDVTGGSHNNTDGEPAWAQLNIKSTVDIMIFSPQETHALSFTPSCFVRIRLRSAFLKGQEMTKRINLTHTHTHPAGQLGTHLYLLTDHSHA